MESCPKVDIPNFKELLEEENFYITTEVTKFSIFILYYSQKFYAGRMIYCGQVNEYISM